VRHVIAGAFRKLRRDLGHGLKPRVLLERVTRYTAELAAAKLYLRDVTSTGSGVRCLGRPRIVNHGTMHLGSHCLLRSVIVPVELTCEEGATLSIGDDCFLNYGVSIGCTNRIELGEHCDIGPYCMIIDTQFHDLHDRSKRPPGVPTIIERDVWLGAKVNVMPGVRIGRGSVIAAGAVVTRDVPPFSVAAGVPAKVVQTLDPSKFRANASAPPDDL